ncbi:MAG TPA: tryptophan synthase subunit beta [Candidatus Omnitrophota bacterium]|nr:tryptophan synthase subunit beta [Candidatus Omnitrophota bacterium]HRY85270.1 tryptophan synthase subunit beta [Candidatus Omnitrophota bacterium]
MKKLPDAKGHFGPYGGRYIPETLVKACEELAAAFQAVKKDKKFNEELRYYLGAYAGRPTPLYEAKNLSSHFGCGRIFLKREDLLHTGAHKINNTLAQGLLAKRLGKKRIVAETGAGQHGVASATAACVFGLKCVVYMGAVDMERQALNVYKMRLLGAEVRPVHSGSKTLKDATNEAIRDWVTNVEDTHYLLGSVVGPHPYPAMVREFQSVIGNETRHQILKLTGRLPAYLMACVGGGSNSMGIFHPFLKDRNVRMVGIEAAGEGVHTHHHAASITKGRPGVLHGMKSYLLQDKNGQVLLAHSISAGLDYPSVGPEHSYLKDSGRVIYQAVTDREALRGFELLTKLEGIMPALEPAHAVGYLPKLMPKTKRNDIVIICLSGRGDKDMGTVQEHLKV